MHINTFDHYQSLESPIHRLDPRVKVVVTAVFILSSVLLPDGAWLAFACSFAFLMVLSWQAKLGFRFVLTRSLTAFPFVLAAVTAVFSVPGEPVLAIKIGPWMLIATDAGIIRFVSIILRSWLSVQMAIILTATTSFPDLIHALRHLRMPGVLVSTIAFMYRYLFVLSDEAVRLLRARDARSARLTGKSGGGSLLWRAQVAGNMAGQLFLRSYERSERIYNAMLARGYRGTLLTLNPHEMGSRDWLLGAVLLAAIAAIQFVGGFAGE